jgi:hypothetical protein
MLLATPFQPTANPPPTTDRFDPSVASDGMTIDTALGPVDLIAIERARAGRPVTLTPAEAAYLLNAGFTAKSSVR